MTSIKALMRHIFLPSLLGSEAKPRVLNDSPADCQTPRCPSTQARQWDHAVVGEVDYEHSGISTSSVPRFARASFPRGEGCGFVPLPLLCDRYCLSAGRRGRRPLRICAISPPIILTLTNYSSFIIHYSSFLPPPLLVCATVLL